MSRRRRSRAQQRTRAQQRVSVQIPLAAKFGFAQTFLLFAAVLLNTTTLPAQDIRAELQRLGASLSACTTLRQQLTYTVYKDHGGFDVLESQSGSYTRQGNAYRVQVGETITLQDGRRQLLVDPETNTLTLMPAQPVQGAGTVDLDQWLSACTGVEVLPAENGRRGCRLLPGPALGGELKQLDIWYDPQRWLLTGLVLYYNQEQNIGDTPQHAVWVKPRLRISYSQTETAPTFKPGAFSLSPYLVFDGKKFSPTPAYKSWQFRDLSGQND